MGRPRNTNKSSHYVDKDELVREIDISKLQDQVTDKLADIFVLIVDGIGYKFPNLAYYGVLEDAKQDALILLCEKFRMIKTDKGLSCFSYITTIVTRVLQASHTKAKDQKYKKNKLVDDVIHYLQHNDLTYEQQLPSD